MVYLEKGTEVGKMTLVSAVVDDITDTVSTEEPVKELRADLEKLSEKCDLDDRDQKREVIHLLKRYSGAFMQKGEPMGRTDKVLHTIDTGDAVPFKIPYR